MAFLIYHCYCGECNVLVSASSTNKKNTQKGEPSVRGRVRPKWDLLPPCLALCIKGWTLSVRPPHDGPDAVNNMTVSMDLTFNLLVTPLFLT